MTVTEFKNTVVDNTLCGEISKEENSNQVLTQCAKRVVTMEMCADTEKPVALAFNALLSAKQHIDGREERKETTTVLIIGANQFGRFCAEQASNILTTPIGDVYVVLADNSIERLITVQGISNDVICWSPEEHEQSLVEKTKSACKGGADIIMDFIGTPRTIQRALKILNKGGALLIGPDVLAKASVNLNNLIAQQQSIIGVHDNKKTNEVTSGHLRLHRLVSYDPFED